MALEKKAIMNEEEFTKAIKSVNKKLELIKEYKLKKLDEEFKIPENCKHESQYRFWYSENHLVSVCRQCFNETELHDRPFLLGDYYDLTAGKYAPTDEDWKRRLDYQEKKNKIRSIGI